MASYDGDRDHSLPTYSTEIVSANNFARVSDKTWEHPSTYEMVDDRELWLQNCAMELTQRLVLNWNFFKE